MVFQPTTYSRSRRLASRYLYFGYFVPANPTAPSIGEILQTRLDIRPVTCELVDVLDSGFELLPKIVEG